MRYCGRSWTRPRSPQLEDYLSSAATDDQGLQRHLSQWEPVIAAVVATVEGSDDAAATLQPLLDELGATSDWGALVAVLRRILAGERNEQLPAGLDAVDTVIARENLRRVAS